MTQPIAIPKLDNSHNVMSQTHHIAFVCTEHFVPCYVMPCHANVLSSFQIDSTSKWIHAACVSFKVFSDDAATAVILTSDSHLNFSYTSNLTIGAKKIWSKNHFCQLVIYEINLIWHLWAIDVHCKYLSCLALAYYFKLWWTSFNLLEFFEWIHLAFRSQQK